MLCVTVSRSICISENGRISLFLTGGWKAWDRTGAIFVLLLLCGTCFMYRCSFDTSSQAFFHPGVNKKKWFRKPNSRIQTEDSLMIMKVPYLGYSLIPAKLRQLVTLSSILQCQHTFTIFRISKIYRSFAGAAIKNLPANAGDVRDAGLIPGSGRSPGEGHDNPLQYSCLESPMDRGTWRATVHRVTKSQTQLKWLGMHARKVYGRLWPLGLKYKIMGCSNPFFREIQNHNSKHNYFFSFIVISTSTSVNTGGSPSLHQALSTSNATSFSGCSNKFFCYEVKWWYA